MPNYFIKRKKKVISYVTDLIYIPFCKDKAEARAKAFSQNISEIPGAYFAQEDPLAEKISEEIIKVEKVQIAK